MKIKKLRFVIYALFIVVVIFLLAVFLPRNYNVPLLQKRSNTQYWELPTGSKIAFTLVPAKGIKKPFPIIYLHGGPGGYIQDGIIKSLSPLSNEGYDIYFYDQIGCGLSDRLADINDYTVDRHVRDLEAINGKLGAQKIILIGQSWGAILATIFTATHEEKTERLVLTSPGPIFPVNRELATFPAPDSFRFRAPLFTNAQGNQKANNIRGKAMKHLAIQFGWKLASDNEADAFATYLNYEVDRSTICDTAKIPPMDAGSGYYAGIMTMKSLQVMKDYRSALKMLKVPVLVMRGQCDNQPWGYTNEYLAVFQNHQLAIIPAAGHYIWVEQPTLYRTSISQFLNEATTAPDSSFIK